jgi:hypothetical protein
MPARVTAIGLVVLFFTGCATVPTGPSVMVLPGTGKSFEQFQADDAVCRSWALQQTGTEPGTAATRDTLTGAAVGAVVGAGLGAAIRRDQHQGQGGDRRRRRPLGGTAIRASTGQSAGQRRRRYDDLSAVHAGQQIPAPAAAPPAYLAPLPPPPPAGPPPPPPPPPS